MTQSRPKIVIVGGGIGGLFAANALVAQGLRVSVYEQAPALREVGAGVYITPNCVRQLQRVGLGPAVEKWADPRGFSLAMRFRIEFRERATLEFVGAATFADSTAGRRVILDPALKVADAGVEQVGEQEQDQ